MYTCFHQCVNTEIKAPDAGSFKSAGFVNITGKKKSMNSFNKYINITQDCEIMLVLKWLGNSDFIAIIPCI